MPFFTVVQWCVSVCACVQLAVVVACVDEGGEDSARASSAGIDEEARSEEI